MRHPSPIRSFRGGGAGEKRKRKRKGRRGREKRPAPSRREELVLSAQRCSPLPLPRLRGGLRAVLGFPLAVPEPCRRMLCPLREAVAARQEWLGSEPANSPFQRYRSVEMAMCLQANSSACTAKTAQQCFLRWAPRVCLYEGLSSP